MTVQGNALKWGVPRGAWCRNAPRTRQTCTHQQAQVDPGRRVVVAFNIAWPTSYSDGAVVARAALILAIRKVIDSETPGA